jgi:polyisoprenoid-binding protein YceI
VFARWGGKISFDPAQLQTSKVAVAADLSSVLTNDANRDNTLKGADFFNVAQTPNALFVSDHITRTSEGYVAAGNLTLGGFTKALAVPFKVTITGKQAVAQGTFRLSRRAFGIGKGQWQDGKEIGDLVQVNFFITATTP